MSIGTAIVTGAASGVGRACTRMLLDQSCRIAAMDLRAETVTAQFPSAGSRLKPIAGDISEPATCARAIAEAIAFLGHVDAFLHFAAVWVGTPWDKSEPAEWDRVLATNVKGTFFLIQAVATHMIERGSGAIVLIASDSVHVRGVAGGPAYVASKGAIIGLTHSFAKALGPRGVRVNAISPGVIETAMTESWPAAVKQSAIAQTPLGRLAEPDEVASVGCFLASEQSRFITGEIVEVNGGFYFH
jgi:NAD(P)-dependent dehydrogenase (short-subunit alcohol dehydrogenase family)